MEGGDSVLSGGSAKDQSEQQHFLASVIWEQGSLTHLSLQFQHDSWLCEYFMAGVTKLTVVPVTGWLCWEK